MNRLLLCFFLLLFINVSAQFQASNWYFGNEAGITFNTNPPTALSGGQINQPEGCASISDAAGNLLFYSDGQTVWDNTNTIMPNGTGLFGYGTSTQSCIIVQNPGNSSQYYLITAPNANLEHQMAYSIIDMTLNDGHGDVTAIKNVTLTDGSEKLTAVRHGNGTDVWILTHELSTNNFDAFLLTTTGISSAEIISSVGSIYNSADNGIGYMRASPCGNKIAAAVWDADYIELFDFDNLTGIVSHPVKKQFSSYANGVYGLEFSPDNTKLYASIMTPGIVFQYDLNAGSDSDIINSQLQIGTSPVNLNGALQTGPDGRIYLVKYGSATLDCITNPNDAGSSCDYSQDFVSLGSGIGQFGLPNFLSSFFCRSVGINEVENDQSISVFPNPATDEIHIQLNPYFVNINFSILILNPLGQCIYSSAINKEDAMNGITLPIRDWSKGIYFVNIIANEKSFSGKFIRI